MTSFDYNPETVHVSGTVVVSGSVTVASGVYLASGLWLASGINVVAGINISGGSVSGQYVVVSGAIVSKVSGETVTVASGAYLASGLWLASGINVVAGTSISGGSTSGQYVVISGAIVSKVSGETVTIASGTTYLASGQAVKVPDLPTIMNEESIWLLRRIVSLLEVGAVSDSKKRQLVTVEAIGRVVATGIPTEVTTSIPIAGAVTTSVSGQAVNVSGNMIGLSVGTSGYLVMNSFADTARLAYAAGMRANLSW
jgi:hypothetical protein